MSEHNLNITIGGEPFEMRRDNTSLFKHVGELALYDHVFFQREATSETSARGTYVFRQSSSFESLEEFMTEHDYPAHINLQEVAECDRQAWDNYMFGDLTEQDTVPEGWE